MDAQAADLLLERLRERGGARRGGGVDHLLERGGHGGGGGLGEAHQFALALRPRGLGVDALHEVGDERTVLGERGNGQRIAAGHGEDLDRAAHHAALRVGGAGAGHAQAVHGLHGGLGGEVLELDHEERAARLGLQFLERGGQLGEFLEVLVLGAHDDGAGGLVGHDARRADAALLALGRCEHGPERRGELRGAVPFLHHDQARRGEAGHLLAVELLDDALDLAEVLAAGADDHRVGGGVGHGAHPVLVLHERGGRLADRSPVGAGGGRGALLALLRVALERGVDGRGDALRLRMAEAEDAQLEVGVVVLAVQLGKHGTQAVPLLLGRAHHQAVGGGIGDDAHGAAAGGGRIHGIGAVEVAERLAHLLRLGVLHGHELGDALHLRGLVELGDELRGGGQLVGAAGDDQSVGGAVGIDAHALRVVARGEELAQRPYGLVGLRVRHDEGLHLDVGGGRAGVELGDEFLHLLEGGSGRGDHQRVGALVGAELRHGERAGAATAAEELLQRGGQPGGARLRERERAQHRLGGGLRALGAGHDLGGGVDDLVDVALGRGDDERAALRIGNHRGALGELAGAATRGRHHGDGLQHHLAEGHGVGAGRELDDAHHAARRRDGLLGLLRKSLRALDGALGTQDHQAVGGAVDGDGDLGVVILVDVGGLVHAARALCNGGGQDGGEESRRARCGIGTRGGLLHGLGTGGGGRGLRRGGGLGGGSQRRLGFGRGLGFRRGLRLRRLLRSLLRTLHQFVDRHHLGAAAALAVERSFEHARQFRGIAAGRVERHGAHLAAGDAGGGVHLLHHGLDLLVLRRGGADHQAVGAAVHGDHRRGCAGGVVREHLRDGLRDFRRFRVAEREDAHLGRAARGFRRGVELGHHLVGDLEDARRAADDHRVEARVRGHAHRRAVEAAAQILLAQLLRHVAQAHHGAIGEELLHERRNGLGARVLQHHRLHLRGVGGAVLVERVDELLDRVEVGRDAGEDQRVRAGGRHDRDLHRVLRGGARHGRGRLLQRGRQLVGVGEGERVHADLLRVGAGHRGGGVELLDQLVGHGNEALRRADDERAGAAVAGDLHQPLAAGELAARTGGEHLLEERAHLVGAAALEDVGLEAGLGHALEVLEHLVHLREGGLVAGDDERAARGLHLHGDFRRLAATGGRRGERAARRERADAGAHLLGVAALDAPGADLRLRGGLDAVELRDDGLELRLAVGRALDDHRVGGGVGADEDVLLLLEVRQRAATRVERHGRLRVELVERRGHFHRASHLERDDHGLALAVLLAAAVDSLDEIADLGEDVLVRGDDERVGGGVRVHAHRLLAAQVGGALVVARGEELRHLRGVGGAHLEEAQRRELPGRHGVELADHVLHRGELRGLTHHPQRVGLLDRLHRRRRERARRVVDLRLGNEVAHGDRQFRGLRLAHGHHAAGALRAVERVDERGDGLELLLGGGHAHLVQRIERVHLRCGELRAVLRCQDLLRHLLQRGRHLGGLRVLQVEAARGAVHHRGLVGKLERLLEARDRRLRAGDGERAAVGGDGDLERTVRAARVLLDGHDALGGGDGLGGLRALDLEHLRAALDAAGLVEDVDDAAHLVALAGERAHHHAARVGSGGDGDGLALRGRLQVADLRDDAGGIGVAERDQRDHLRVGVDLGPGGTRRTAVAVERLDERGALGHALRGADDRQLADLVHGQHGGLHFLGKLRVELLEPRLRLGGRHATEHHGAHAARDGRGRAGDAGRRSSAGGGHVEQLDHVGQLHQPRAHAARHDGVGALVGGHGEPFHLALLDLGLLAVGADHVLHLALAHQRGQAGKQGVGLGVAQREEAHLVVRLGLVDRVDHLEHAADLAARLHDDERVLRLERRHRAVRAHQVAELLRDRRHARGLQRQHQRDDGVVGDGGGKFAHERGDVLALHVRELLQVELVLLHAEHHVLRLEQLVHRGERLGQRVRARADVVDGAIGHLGLADHRQARGAAEVVEDLVPALALEREADAARGGCGRVLDARCGGLRSGIGVRARDGGRGERDGREDDGAEVLLHGVPVCPPARASISRASRLSPTRTL